MQFQLLKVVIQSVQVRLIRTTFRWNQTQFRREDVPSLGYHMGYPRLSHAAYELEKTISYSDLTICKLWNEYLESLQMNISNDYCKKRKHHLHISAVYLIALFTRLFHLYSNVNHKRPQTTNKRPTNHHKLPQTMSKRPQTTTNHQQKTTSYQQMNTNYQQRTTNGHPFTSNQKSDVSFLLPPPGN